MCSPPMAIAAIGGAIQAGGAIYGGITAQRSANSEAALYESQRSQRLQKAEFDVETLRRQYRRESGRNQAESAASGIDVASFSDVFADDAKEFALEVEAIRYSAKSEAAMLRYRSEMARKRGKEARTASYFQAAGALFGAAGPALNQRYANAGSGATGGVGGSAGGVDLNAGLLK